MYIRKELYDVVLSSGTTMFPEIVERITNELTALASINDENQGDCSDSEWIGGFFLSSLSFQQMWTSKGEYDESRPSSSTVVFAHLRATVFFIHDELFFFFYFSWFTVSTVLTSL